MKFSPKQLSIGLIGMAFTALLSCQPQSDLTPDSGKSPESTQVGNATVRIKDGRVVFKSLDDFKATIQGLKRMNESERNEWEKSIGHVSMISFYSNNDGIIMGTKNPIYKTMKEDKPYISDILFGRIVNSDGIFQIGNDCADR